jgi:DNA mismatch repair protein MutS
VIDHRGKAARSRREQQLPGAVGGSSRAGGEIALAWIDISTGQFRMSASAPERLLSDIMRVGPREITVAESVFRRRRFRPVFDHARTGR